MYACIMHELMYITTHIYLQCIYVYNYVEYMLLSMYVHMYVFICDNVWMYL